MVKDREFCSLQSMGSQRIGYGWVAELNLMIPSDFSLLFGFATNFNVVATFYCTWILEGLQWGKSQPTLNVMCSCCCSATQPYPILCDPMDCSTPGLPVHHQSQSLLKLMSIWVSDAIQPSHPLSSPSPPVFSLPQHQGLVQWVSSLHQLAKVLEFQCQHQSFQWIFRTDFL